MEGVKEGSRKSVRWRGFAKGSVSRLSSSEESTEEVRVDEIWGRLLVHIRFRRGRCKKRT